MAALNLHHALFTTERESDPALRSASPFLRPAPERDSSPTSHLFATLAYQDLIQRQPTHPDGPTSGWDLGLNLFGDPITDAEYKHLEGHQTKMKLRRLHAINVALELLIGMWGTYTTVRYCLAIAQDLNGTKGVFSLVLGIISALAVALVILSMSMPLLPQYSHPQVWRYTRSLLRACYLLLLYAAATVNLILVLVWHPSELCHWDIDISWYTSTTNTISSPCQTTPFSAWLAAAILRLVMTSALALLFVYTLRLFYSIRHPASKASSAKYSAFFPSDLEYTSHVSTPSPLGQSKLTFKQSESSHTFNQSIVTLPKSISISTLAPSTSCHSRSQSTPSSKDVAPPRISPPTSRRTSVSTHGTNHPTQYAAETPPGTQPVTNASAPPMLRRTSRISVGQATSDAPSPDMASERFDSPPSTRDSSEIRSCTSWKPSHRGSGSGEVRKSSWSWENAHFRHASQTSVVESRSTIHDDDGESVKEKAREDVLVYSYGYGASGPTYPYLDMYNPQRQAAEATSCEPDTRGHPALCDDASSVSEPRSWVSREDDGGESSGEEEEEYVAMMGGFVRRMATIESLGSKEATGTLSTTTSGSVARHPKTPNSQFSSGRLSLSGSSLGPMGTEGSHGTAYLSLSSGGMRVNERGELLSVRDGRGAAGSSYDRIYYTATSGSLPRTVDDEDR